MTTGQRALAAALSGTLALSGFLFGRATTPSSTRAEEERAASTHNQPNLTTPATAETNSEQAFYLSDYQTGYSAGYQAGMTGQANLANTARAGYNEGFKEGYADGYQARLEPQANSAGNRYQTIPIVHRDRSATRNYARPVYYKSQPRRSSSKLKTALTIAAPAAIGAGIGAAAGGKKGAGVGALLGGGGGALYHLIKNRNRD